MANVVPLNNQVSIKGIRDVINLKSVILGHVYVKKTTRTRYGYDKSNGVVYIKLKNQESNYSPTLKLTLLRYGATVSTQTFVLNSGKTVIKEFTGIPGYEGQFSTGYKDWQVGGTDYVSYTGDLIYRLKLEETTAPNRSATTSDFVATEDHEESVARTITLGSNNPITNISMGEDTDSGVTSNWNLRGRRNIPETLQNTIVGTKLSDWRGSQVMEGSFITGNSRKGRYTGDQHIGTLSINLNPIGFSGESVTVSIIRDSDNKFINEKTKDIKGSTRSYIFQNLKKGAYRIKITDNITGQTKIYITEIGLNEWWQAISYSSTAFNGLDTMIGATWNNL